MSQILINIPYLEENDINGDGSLKAYVGKGKPVLMMIQGNFCPHCTVAKPAFQKLAKLPNVVVVTVQTDGGDSDRGAARKLSSVNKSPGVPAFLAFDSKGVFIKAHDGQRDENSLAQFIMSCQ